MMEIIKENKIMHVLGTVVIAAVLICVGMYVLDTDHNTSASNATPQTVIESLKAGQVFEYGFVDGPAEGYKKFTCTAADGKTADVKEYNKFKVNGVVVSEGTISEIWDASWVAEYTHKGNTSMIILGKNTDLSMWENDDVRLYISADNVICAVKYTDEGTMYILKGKNV